MKYSNRAENPEIESGFNKDKAYILGCIHGDGSIFGEKRSHTFQLMVSERDFAESFKSAVKDLGFEPREHFTNKASSDMYTVNCRSKNFCQKYKDINLEDLRNKLFRSETYQKQYVKGLYESEGWVRNKSERGLEISLEVISNQDKDIIKLCEEILDNLGYKYSKYSEERKNATLYRLRLKGRSKEKLSFLEDIQPSIKSIETLSLNDHNLDT